ncbi:squalene/phytoene synthase family protein [uncultured Maricaulis sp.]|uniref:squalene/phytoene synthase family protein n=1 Tax=uncultured Maricaulis sp. TaxID=174710 RepID=UPI0030DD0A0D|tara:strand:- start:85731 stop:86546 length:816 start_codon:yes stop_codon:yes gene_type:complete
MSAEDLSQVLQQADPDRRLAALFAPAGVRERLFALYALNHEIGRIADATSESLIGEMKLTWWRDAVTDLYAETPKVRRHVVTEALAPLTGLLPQAELLDLIDARFDDIAAAPHADLDALVDYVDRTSVRLVRLALVLTGGELPQDQIRDAGRAWGLTGLMRAFAWRARIGRAPVAGDYLTELGGTPAMLAQGLGPDKASAAIQPVRAIAEDAAHGFAAAGPLPAEAVPATGYVVLARGYLKRLPRNPFEISPERALLARQARLSWLSLTGR